MTVSIISVEGDKRTWDDSTFTWDSVSSQRSWDEFSPFAHLVEVETAIGFLESEYPRFKALEFYETINVRGVINRNANLIISDMAVYNAPMTDAEFAEHVNAKSHLGYEKFRNLVPGDYKYTTAMIGITVDNSTNPGNTAITEAKLTVDAPDILNKGTVSVADTGWTTVTFPRPYNTTDELEVSVMFRGGATIATPTWQNVTETGFEVKLFSTASPGTQVEGTITYDARGY